uniref:Uncharacterized protein n=1 Tax=Romanomermis culicivorax TaxID=13658 RepID=A0A915KM82_ROMCU
QSPPIKSPSSSDILQPSVQDKNYSKPRNTIDPNKKQISSADVKNSIKLSADTAVTVADEILQGKKDQLLQFKINQLKEEQELRFKYMTKEHKLKIRAIRGEIVASKAKADYFRNLNKM